MVRAISVLLAVLVLLGVGWYLGQRPVTALKSATAEIETSGLKRSQDLDLQARGFEERAQALEARARTAEERAAVAEAKSELWQARSEMLVGAIEAGKLSFSRSKEWATAARDRVTHAMGVPGMTLDLGPVRDMLDTAVRKLTEGDSDASNVLMRAATELRRLLEQAGQA